MPAWVRHWPKRGAHSPCGITPVTPATSTAPSVPILPRGRVMSELKRIAVFGGLYSNYLALAAALADIRSRGVDAVFCLGDLGAFGPHPDRVFPLLQEHGVLCLQGNYDHSIGNGLADCQCGYTDPRDNHFARLSYEYTFHHTSDSHRRWLKELPAQRR